ncbi:MAG TPA: CPBP family intramembrane glutamic endopeptidase [Chitinophagaceae bacterium]|nr:CPBP family intramembrane glutamic endopeptidase [Chitinophagaceae bacterium]
MRWKDFFFCIAVIGVVFLIGKIPVQDLLEYYAVPEAEDIRYTITGIIAILVCVLIARRQKILISGGFLRPIKKNYWMLLLPLLFPGLVFVMNLNFGCHKGNLAVGITILLFLIRGLMEEVIFRGVIQGYLRKQYPGKSLHKIIFISAAFFAVVHFTNIQYGGIQNILLQIIYAFYMGLFFGALMIRINNVWLLGIVHGVLNMFTVRCDDLQDNHLSKIDIGSLLGMLLMFSPVLIIYWLLMITNKPKPEM